MRYEGSQLRNSRQPGLEAGWDGHKFGYQGEGEAKWVDQDTRSIDPRNMLKHSLIPWG